MTKMESLARDIQENMDIQGVLWVRDGNEYFPSVEEITEFLESAKETILASSDSASVMKGGILVYRYAGDPFISVYMIQGEISVR